MGGLFPFLDPLLRRPALVVEADDGPVRPGQGGDDEAHPGEELPEVMLDLGDHPSRPVPGGGLILNAAVADQRGVAGSAAWPGEQVLDGPLQHVIGREADGVRPAPPLQRLVEGRDGKGRVGSDDDVLPSGLVPLNDMEEDLVPPVSTVDVPRPELGGEAVPVLVEDEQRMIADGLEVAVVGRLLLRAVNRTLGAVDIEGHAPGGWQGGIVRHQVSIEA